MEDDGTDETVGPVPSELVSLSTMAHPAAIPVRDMSTTSVVTHREPNPRDHRMIASSAHGSIVSRHPTRARGIGPPVGRITWTPSSGLRVPRNAANRRRPYRLYERSAQYRVPQEPRSSRATPSCPRCLRTRKAGSEGFSTAVRIAFAASEVAVPVVRCQLQTVRGIDDVDRRHADILRTDVRDLVRNRWVEVGA